MFTFFVASGPSVTAVTPGSGPTTGGTTVTITGTGFSGVTKVAFGAVLATSFTVVSDHRDHRRDPGSSAPEPAPFW